MNFTRKDNRMLAMTILYQYDLFKRKEVNLSIEEVIDINLIDVEGNVELAKELVNGVLEKEEKIVNLANSYLNNWNLSRLGIVDAAILKIAIYEILYTKTPAKVCIDEAIELAKDFSDEKVVGMINGVLDKVYHNLKEDNKSEK